MCESEVNSVELKYEVVLSESQCISRPLSSDVTVNVLLYFR